MQDLPHAPGYTLAADAFMGPAELVGFSVAHHQLNVFSHFHEFYELGLVLQGTGVHLTTKGGQPVARGDVVFVAPGASHGWEMCEDLIVYNCFLRVEAAQSDIYWAARDPRLGLLFAPAGQAPRPPIVLTLDDDTFRECHGHLEAIRLRATTDRSEAFDLGHLLLALDVLARRLEAAGLRGWGASPAAPPVVRSAVQLLERDLQRHWTLAELSSELCLGVFHLVRLFKLWVGLPPVAYANRRRAERAAVLLASTDDTVASIGADVGWPDASHFARRFRREYGVSPRAYRTRSRIHRGLEPPASRPRDAALAQV
jgi:AraC family L-rhamnose operon transcriptional activator RhaR